MDQKDYFVGGRISLRRTAKRMTQEQLAMMLNVSPAAVSKWERNLANPSIEMLWRLADFFDCSIDDLVGRTSVRAADAREKEKLRLTEIAGDLIKCSEISRAQGLIAMEEAVMSMESGSRFLSFAVSYVMLCFMRQMELEKTFELLDNYVETLPSAERMEGKMVAGALKMIFEGNNPQIIQEYVASCIGMEYREELEGMGSALRRARKEILNLYGDKKQYSEATGLLEGLCSTGDYEIQQILRQMDQKTLAAALAGASKDVVLAFLSNLSDRMMYVVSEDIQLFGGGEEEIIEAQRKVLEIKQLLSAEQTSPGCQS